MRTSSFDRLKTFAALALVAAGLITLSAQQKPPAPASPPAAPAAPAGPPTPVKLELTDGSKVRYRVREQLAGISFPSDAVGVAEGVKGVIVIKADGTIDSAQSKLTLDLTTFKSDQEMRDGYLQRRTLETDKFATAEFAPRRVEGMPYPFPTAQSVQAGFMLTGDMTMHGVTKELTWKVISTFPEGRVTGIATTSFPFATFNLAKPSLARLLSVDDTITLELEFKATKTAM